MEKLYFYEHNVEHNIFSTLTLPYTVIVAALGAIFFLLNKIPTTPTGFLWWTTVVFLALSSVPIVVAATYLVRASFGHRYAYVDAVGMEAYCRRLIQYHDTHSKEPDERSMSEFQDALIEQYANATDHNARINEKRKRYRRNAYIAIIFVGVALLISAVPLEHQTSFRKQAWMAVTSTAMTVWRGFPHSVTAAHRCGRPRLDSEFASGALTVHQMQEIADERHRSETATERRTPVLSADAARG